jgi:class 3 adenylate cyclase
MILDPARSAPAASPETEAFARLIKAHADTRDDALRARIEQDVWQRYGTSGTVLISDMASFSRISRVHGICHYLGLIHRVRKLWTPIIGQHGGVLLKCEADNCYAFFDRPDDAMAASVEVHGLLTRANADEAAEDRVFLSIGIDYGDLLMIGNDDFFGDPVNTASKLGEDLAGKGETLVTRRALERCEAGTAAHGESLHTRISEIEIEYYRFRHG